MTFIGNLFTSALVWFFGLFERRGPLPLITEFRWVNKDFNQAKAKLRYEDGDIRFVYSDDQRWYYVGGIAIEDKRLVNHLADRQLKEKWRLEGRREVGLC